MTKMPDNIQNIYDNLTGFQKTYCEYRSRGLSQAVAAEKSGSAAKDKGALASVGFQVESTTGIREYIDFLKEERAKTLPIDETEVVGKLRKVYEKAMEDGDYKAANEAVKLLGMVVGTFGAGKTGPRSKQDKEDEANPFKDEGMEPGTVSNRLNKILAMQKDLDKEA